MLCFKDYSGPKNLKLRNRVVMAPMCTYASDNTGQVKDFHKIHYGARALGGLGLIIVEATGISYNGRISSRDLGIWSNTQLEGLKNLADTIKSYGSLAGIQLAHAGRKSEVEDQEPIGPSALAFNEEYRLPRELTKEEIKNLVRKFQEAAIRADAVGYDFIEVHGAHGYLIHEFLSPLSNKRKDAYGGSLENRVRFLREVLIAIKEVWPSNKALGLRISASDYTEGGLDIGEVIEILKIIKPFIDLVHVSSGGLVEADIPVYSGYQVEFARQIKEEVGLPTIAVGLITRSDEIEDIIQDEKADLVGLGRVLLRDPHFVLNEAYKNKEDYSYPKAYIRAYK